MGLLTIEPRDSELNDKIFIQSKKILNRPFIYDTDGLIYLPANLPVSSDLCGNSKQTINGEWLLNYKYKPPHENTIDFRVFTDKIIQNRKQIDRISTISTTNSDNSKQIVKCKKLILNVAYNQYEDTSLDYSMMSLNHTEINNKRQKIFDPPNTDKNISFTNIILENNKMICEKDKREIQNNDIVEMRYNFDEKYGDHWIPLRIRNDDKDNPQFFKAANNIWGNILNQVDDDMISGGIDYRNIESIDKDEYYDNELNMSCSFPLRKFHNYVKLKLIQNIGSLNDLNQILDTSIGRGGDIDKYLNKNMNTIFLLAMDLYPVDEACRRLYYSNINSKIPSVILRYDTSKDFTNDSGLVGTSSEKSHSQLLLGIIYGTVNQVPSKYRGIKNKYQNKALSKFNLISSQFSIHYYFKDQLTLHQYLQNISDNCMSGGYFIGTCYDGMLIYNDLERYNKIEYHDDFKNKIYSIIKKYNIKDFNYNPEDTQNMLGIKIDVYMDSIGKYIEEYLVNFDYFIDKMKEFGFSLYKPNNNILNMPINNFKSILDNLQELNSIDPDINDNIMSILDNPELMRLSSYNNYFIFQKN